MLLISLSPGNTRGITTRTKLGGSLARSVTTLKTLICLILVRSPVLRAKYWCNQGEESAVWRSSAPCLALNDRCAKRTKQNDGPNPLKSAHRLYPGNTRGIMNEPREPRKYPGYFGTTAHEGYIYIYIYYKSAKNVYTIVYLLQIIVYYKVSKRVGFILQISKECH